MDDPDLIPTSDSLGRSFMATHGRTSSDVELLALESVVGRAQQAWRDRYNLTFERREIIEGMTIGPLSIPEVSVSFSLPLLTAQLLVSEMVRDGLLTVVAEAAEEIDVRTLQIIREKIEKL